MNVRLTGVTLTVASMWKGSVVAAKERVRAGVVSLSLSPSLSPPSHPPSLTLMLSISLALSLSPFLSLFHSLSLPSSCSLQCPEVVGLAQSTQTFSEIYLLKSRFALAVLHSVFNTPSLVLWLSEALCGLGE